MALGLDPVIGIRTEAERLRRSFAAAWGAIGAAWGIAPSTATVQGYLLVSSGQEIVTAMDEYLAYALDRESTKVVALLLGGCGRPAGIDGKIANDFPDETD